MNFRYCPRCVRMNGEMFACYDCVDKAYHKAFADGLMMARTVTEAVVKSRKMFPLTFAKGFKK